MTCIDFFKYQQGGNDFIIFYDAYHKLPAIEINKLCHRKFGIGADGMIFLQKIGVDNFRMQIFNSDGYEVESCGNGICCSAKLLKDNNLISSNSINIKLLNSVVNVLYKDQDVVVKLEKPFDFQFNQNLSLSNDSIKYHFVNTGVPHFVTFVNDLNKVEILKIGSLIRNHHKFSPNGTNVNFAMIKNEYEIVVRTYERGIEGETLSCGTGASAVALIGSFVYNLRSPIKVCHPGGNLIVDFHRNSNEFQHLSIIGKPEKIYSGQLSMKKNYGVVKC